MKQKIDKAIDEELILPEGFAERMEHFVDHLPQMEQERSTPQQPFMPRMVMWISSCAAVLAIAFFTLYTPNKQYNDTFDSVAEAEKATIEALVLVSKNLNKGIAATNIANSKLEKTTHILQKKLKLNAYEN